MASEGYYDQRLPYGNADLIQVGFLLLMKQPQLLLDRRVWTAIKELLKMAIQKPDPNDKEVNKNKGMFCSQFVYQCFLDAGIVLDIKNPTLRLFAAVGESSGTKKDNTILDAVMNQVDLNEVMALDGTDLKLFAEAKPGPSKSKDEVLLELYEALKASEDRMMTMQEEADETVPLDPELVRAIIEFALFLDDAAPAEPSMMTAAAPPAPTAERMMSALEKVRAANRVTPGDLTRLQNPTAVHVGNIRVPHAANKSMKGAK